MKTNGDEWEALRENNFFSPSSSSLSRSLGRSLSLKPQSQASVPSLSLSLKPRPSCQYIYVYISSGGKRAAIFPSPTRQVNGDENARK